MQVFLLKEYAPRMGVAMDIFAVNSSASEKNYELTGHVYEDGSERVSIGVEKLFLFRCRKNLGGESVSVLHQNR